jgi:hypothetical protein
LDLLENADWIYWTRDLENTVINPPGSMDEEKLTVRATDSFSTGITRQGANSCSLFAMKPQSVVTLMLAAVAGNWLVQMAPTWRFDRALYYFGCPL